MHLFKYLILTCSISTVALANETQTPAFNPHKIEAGILDLNRSYHEITKAQEHAQTQQQEMSKQIQALVKASRRGWPFSARLVALGLTAFIAWEHKDMVSQENATKARENATKLWQHRETITTAVKDTAAITYHNVVQSYQWIKETLQKSIPAQESKAGESSEKQPYSSNE